MRSLGMGYHLSITMNNALPELWQPAKIEVRTDHFIGNAPTEWLTRCHPPQYGALSCT